MVVEVVVPLLFVVLLVVVVPVVVVSSLLVVGTIKERWIRNRKFMGAVWGAMVDPGPKVEKKANPKGVPSNRIPSDRNCWRTREV